MAGLYICPNYASTREYELTKSVTTKGNNTSIPFLAIFQTQNLVFAQV